MDPLSLTCNIGAVITITAQLLSVGSTYGSSVANFPKEIQKLILELTSLSEILNALKTIIEQPLPCQDNGATNPQPMIVQLLSSPFEEYEKSLQIVLASLEKEKEGNKVQRMLKRAVWPLKEADTIDFFMRLERYKKTFTLALSADEMVLTRSIHSDIGAMRRYQIMEREMKKLATENEKFRKILSWVSAADTEINHVSARELQQAGTGKWFTDGETYRNWLSQDDSFLWLYGIPGAGKTILASMIIDRVMSEIHTSTNATPAVVYFYFDFKESSKRTTVGLLGSLVAQLVQKKSKIPDDLEDLYHQSCASRKPPDASSLENCLNSLIKQFSKVVLIIDALDECVERGSVMERLQRLQGNANLNLLVTSRDEEDIKLQFDNLPSLSIKEEDVSVDIETFVTSELMRQPKLQRLKHSTKLDIVSSLTNGANGMFRWAKCCLDEISKLRTDRAIKAALKTLPPTLEASYERILCNIPQGDQIFATRIFQWLLCSLRPMSLLEIVDAISVEVGDTFMDPDSKLNDPKDVLHICGGLVQLNKSNMTVGLAHFTVEGYLRSTNLAQGPAAAYKIPLQNSNPEVAKICLTYILLSDFDAGPGKTEEEWESRLAEYPLLRYAPWFWKLHIAKYEIGSDKILDDLVLTFFRLEKDSGIFRSWWYIYSTGHKCSWEFIKDPIESETLLYLAAEMGQHPAVRDLLESGADINQKGDRDRKITPLVIAAREGHRETVRLLLEKGRDLFEKGEEEFRPLYKPLRTAAAESNADCVQLLLDYGGEEGPSWAQCCLRAISDTDIQKPGCERVMEVVLATEFFQKVPTAKEVDYHLDDISKTHPFLSLLWACVYQGWGKCFQYMYEMASDTIVTAYKGMILGECMTQATIYGHVKFVKLFLRDEKVKTYIEGHKQKFQELLLEGAYYGQDKIIELLLGFKEASGIDLNEFMGISLHTAASRGHTSIMDRLLRAGASPLHKDDDGWSPFDYASTYHQDSAMEKLSVFVDTSNPEVSDITVGSKSCLCGQHPQVISRKPENTVNSPAQAVYSGPVIPPCANYSFEAEIFEEDVHIGFGDFLFSHTFEGKNLLKRPPGSIDGLAWGYSCGQIRFSDRIDYQAVEPFRVGDFVGCHFDRPRELAFFTVNGKIVGKKP